MVVAATRPEDLLEVCDSFSVLRDGTLVWSGDATAAAALAAPQFANTFAVDPAANHLFMLGSVPGGPFAVFHLNTIDLASGSLLSNS